MDKPWFKLDPNNSKDPWWLYTSITDTTTASMEKSDLDIQCYFIIQDHNMEGIFYRISVWFKNDPNRYTSTRYNNSWKFNKKLNEMNEGDIVNTFSCNFKVYNCRFSAPSQIDMCKILVRVEE